VSKHGKVVQDGVLILEDIFDAEADKGQKNQEKKTSHGVCLNPEEYCIHVSLFKMNKSKDVSMSLAVS